MKSKPYLLTYSLKYAGFYFPKWGHPVCTSNAMQEEGTDLIHVFQQGLVRLLLLLDDVHAHALCILDLEVLFAYYLSKLFDLLH